MSIVGFVHCEDSILDALDLLLPKYSEYKKPFRVEGHGEPKFLGSKFVFLISSLSGDHPALSEMTGLMMTAGATFPCKHCLIECKYKKNPVTKKMVAVLPLNDTTRWIAPLRTQDHTRECLTNMRRDRLPLDQTKTGIRNIFKKRKNPMFQYFEDLPISMFEAIEFDPLHDLDIGLLSSVFSACASIVLENKENTRSFLACMKLMSQEYVVGFDGTIYRDKDINPNSETTLLHLLKKEQLYGREYRMFAPTICLALSVVQEERLQAALPAVGDLVCFSTALRSRYYPHCMSNGQRLQGNETIQMFYTTLQAFGIEAYEILKKKDGFKVPFSDDSKHIKIHEALCHFIFGRQRHGKNIGVDHLESFFRLSKRLHTNGKGEVGLQLFTAVFFGCDAGRLVLEDQNEAVALREIFDVIPTERASGTIPLNEFEAPIVQTLITFFDCRNSEELSCTGVAVKWHCMGIVSSEGLKQRGPSKVYACPKWYGKEKYDFVQREDDSIAQLQCLFLHKQTQQLYAVAKRMQKSNLVYMRMPTYLMTEELIIFPFDSDETHVVAVRKYPTSLSPASRELLQDHEQNWELYVLLIFTTASMGRYHDEKIWFPKMNKPHRMTSTDNF